MSKNENWSKNVPNLTCTYMYEEKLFFQTRFPHLYLPWKNHAGTQKKKKKKKKTNKEMKI